MINKEQHESLLQDSTSKDKLEFNNTIPKNIIRLEKYFDLQDKFRKPKNTKTNRSSLKYEVVNLNMEQHPENINLGTNCSPAKRTTLIKLFKEYKDVFTWTYDYLKTYDMNIIQQIIPMKEDAKPSQQKLQKMHLSLEPLIKKELNKLLETKIIFLVCHITWVENLVLGNKKSGEIWICIYFQNINRENLKDNYPVPLMDKIIQSVSR